MEMCRRGGGALSDRCSDSGKRFHGRVGHFFLRDAYYVTKDGFGHGDVRIAYNFASAPLFM